MREATRAEILPYVESAGRYGCDAKEVERILSQDRHFILSQNGADLLGYSVQIVGDEFFVSSAAGKSRIDLCRLMHEIVQLQAVGFKTAAFKTIRPGLVRKAQKLGYQRYPNNIMRKTL